MLIDNNSIIVGDHGDSYHFLGSSMLGTELVTFYLFPVIIVTLPGKTDVPERLSSLSKVMPLGSVRPVFKPSF